MLWEHERCYGLVMDALVIGCTWNAKNTMHVIRSTSGLRNTSNVWFVPRRPRPKRSAKYTFFARARSGGANNKNHTSSSTKAKNKSTKNDN